MPIYRVKKKDGVHPHSTFLSDFILGSQDGLVNVLGIILGVSAATSDMRILFVAALAALGAESVSMGAVAYTSTLARHKQYFRDIEQEKQEIKDRPGHVLDGIRKILKGWKYRGNELDSLAKGIAKNPNAAMEFLMSFERKSVPVDRSAPFRSFVTVLLSTIIGSAIPVLPFLFLKSVPTGAMASVIISGITLFGIGYYEAKTTVGSLWRSGLQMLIIGLSAGLVGYLIGHLIGAVPI